MNEKIRELANRAFWDRQVQTNSDEYAYLNKFAELIIKECVAKVEELEKDSRNHVSYFIKQHFGVE